MIPNNQVTSFSCGMCRAFLPALPISCDWQQLSLSTPKPGVVALGAMHCRTDIVDMPWTTHQTVTMVIRNRRDCPDDFLHLHLGTDNMRKAQDVRNTIMLHMYRRCSHFPCVRHRPCKAAVLLLQQTAQACQNRQPQHCMLHANHWSPRRTWPPTLRLRRSTGPWNWICRSDGQP
jgi:hypothetical protein